MNAVDILINTKNRYNYIDIGDNVLKFQINPYVAIEDLQKLIKKLTNETMILNVSNDTSPGRVLYYQNKFFLENMKNIHMSTRTFEVMNTQRSGFHYNYYFTSHQSSHELVQFYCEKSKKIRLGIIVASTFDINHTPFNIYLNELYNIKKRNPNLFKIVIRGLGLMCKNTGMYNIATDKAFINKIIKIGSTDAIDETIFYLKEGMRKRDVLIDLQDFNSKFTTENKLVEKLICVIKRSKVKLSEYNIPEHVIKSYETENYNEIMPNHRKLNLIWSKRKGSLYNDNTYNTDDFNRFPYITEVFIHPDSNKKIKHINKIYKVSNFFWEFNYLKMHISSKQFCNFYKIKRHV